jgi:hypothetical protein
VRRAGLARPGSGPGPGSQVHRLLRWYPGSWRERYGAEFAELLAAELSERPRNLRRTADVIRCGLTARLASAGFAADPAGQAAPTASLGALAGALAVFLTFGTALWAQLATGWQWAPPASAATTVGLLVMSGALLLLATLALAAAVPLAWSAARAMTGGQSRGLRFPALLTGAGALVLVVGARHFGNGWPGTGGHWWAHQGLAPGGAAAFGWASTLGVTSYWAHPAALASFPAAELAWMAASPVATLLFAAGAILLVRRTEVSPRALRYEKWAGRIAVGAMTAFLGGALCWVTQSAPAPAVFRTGAIDAAGLAAMTLALVTGWRAMAHR